MQCKAILVLCLCHAILAFAGDVKSDPFEESLTWDLINGEDKENLVDGDSIKLTVHCQNPWDPRGSIPKGHFRVSLKQEGDSWWKAITKFSSDGTFLNEVVEIADLKGIAKSADIDKDDLKSDPKYVLSKAKFLGAHTNLYKIANFADMKEGCEYAFDWYHVGKSEQANSSASVAVADGWERVKFNFHFPFLDCEHGGSWNPLEHGDAICLTGKCHPLSDVPEGKVRITLQSRDTWWKAITLWKDNSYVSELVHVQDDKSAVDAAVMDASAIPDWQFVLSKAGFLGVHTNPYLIENSDDMKEGCEYNFHWKLTLSDAENITANVFV
eukprot:TRINITY_DN58430_c0_g1_i1.p1 TRINITY_DN58430_c0_g1~~TRINITY_DN58430_c0_g1_i1.p1  ORF type:complete len:366 (-),score=75.80 TRINITY_DN58430_c0_g1_i1:458-1435(-)